MADTVSRSWFAVFPNPEQHGYEGSPEDIIEKLKQEWIGSNPLRKGWWGYCISEKGLPHVHMVLEDTGSCRFTKVKKAYPTAHLEPTKGNKKQVLAYIKKEPPFDEKGEQVLVFTSYGNIEGNKRFAVSNTNDTLATIEMLIEEGMTPNQIMAEDIRLRREENLIRKCYFAKRYKETPPIRTVKVVWHCGDSGCGKSYSYIDLCEKYGDDLVYFFSDYANRGVGGFDGYCGEPYLFMDELKQDSLPFIFYVLEQEFGFYTFLGTLLIPLIFFIFGILGIVAATKRVEIYKGKVVYHIGFTNKEYRMSDIRTSKTQTETYNTGLYLEDIVPVYSYDKVTVCH